MEGWTGIGGGTGIGGRDEYWREGWVTGRRDRYWREGWVWEERQILEGGQVLEGGKCTGRRYRYGEEGTGITGRSVADQVPDEKLGAALDGKMQWSAEGGVLHLGVDIHPHTEQEEHGLHVLRQHRLVDEVLAPCIHLEGR